MRSVLLQDDEAVPALGQGTWRMGEDPSRRRGETAAIRAGVDLGMTVIDTAEMYGEGASETFLGEALANLRERIFLVSKVYPQNASRARMGRACDSSLRRLRTDHLDLYLLHWRGTVPLAETIEAMEALRRSGKIRHWGVSNFDADDMDDLLSQGGQDCATNQILYNVGRRGPEFDLLPWLDGRSIPAMAYSPVEQGHLLDDPTLKAVARRRGAEPLQWRWPGCCAEPTCWPFRRRRASSMCARTGRRQIWCWRRRMSNSSTMPSRRRAKRCPWRCCSALPLTRNSR